VTKGQVESEAPVAQAVEKRVNQTILVVEDHPAVRGMVRETLEQLGYTVLEATDGYEALRMIEKETREIQLLLTDVIMPLMNGRELATRLRSLRPETKVLYMSGYTDEVLAFHGIAHPEISFIQKPFTNPELAAKIELALAG
jgi:two-component system cell cycle sensor histidine kinase/response regulator CckA